MAWASRPQQTQTTLQVQKRIPTDWTDFNREIGLPRLPVNNQPHPFLDYQNKIGRCTSRDILINKSQKIGVTETVMRKVIQKSVVGDLQGYDVIYCSSKGDLAKENLRRTEEIFEKSDLLRPYVVESIATRMTLTNGTRIMALPADPSALLSWARVKCIFWDEAAHKKMQDDSRYMSAQTSRLGPARGYWYVVSNPNGMHNSFYTLTQMAKGGLLPGTAFFELPYTLGLGIFFDESFIEKERQRLGPRFAEMYECSFKTTTNAAIPEEYIDKNVAYDEASEVL